MEEQRRGGGPDALLHGHRGGVDLVRVHPAHHLPRGRLQPQVLQEGCGSTSQPPEGKKNVFKIISSLLTSDYLVVDVIDL